MNVDKPTVLIVDDTPTNIEILINILTQYNIIVSSDGYDAIDIMKNSTQIDLILLDIMMPGIDGYEVCEYLKKNHLTQDTPIIFITAKSDEESIEYAYNAGGVDYITKPFKPREVLARVKVHIEHAKHVKQLEYLASYDPMTGIYNRRKFFELAVDIFMESKNNELYAVILDIDHFKKINDQYGHPAGDKVIVAVADTISTLLDKKTVFARIGGEEFVILIQTPVKKYAIDTIENCIKAIEKLSISYDDILLNCTISIGMASKHRDDTTLDQLLTKADHALYEAKNNGRNQLKFRT